MTATFALTSSIVLINCCVCVCVCVCVFACTCVTFCTAERFQTKKTNRFGTLSFMLTLQQSSDKYTITLNWWQYNSSFLLTPAGVFISVFVLTYNFCFLELFSVFHLDINRTALWQHETSVFPKFPIRCFASFIKFAFPKFIWQFRVTFIVYVGKSYVMIPISMLSLICVHFW